MELPHDFTFRWKGHIPHLSQVFCELRFEEVYCDTTLITEDGFIMKAHGAVLIATSRYFERVLADVTPDQHPMIVLKGINYEELSYLLDYIYQGVTQVDQHMMESVLDVADLLEIKGLSKMKNNLSLKKLLAPSVMSAAASRDSPSCSSTSKSPSPLSPQSPNSPSSDVYVQSFSLKTDHEEINDGVAYESPQTRHNYAEKSVGTEKSFDAGDYIPSASSKNALLSAEYLDQTLGIDLSLSRGSCEENGKSSRKNLNAQEETPLRKRKNLHSEEGLSTSELNCSKFEESKMTEGLIIHQKKKVFSKSRPENAIKLESKFMKPNALDRKLDYSQQSIDVASTSRSNLFRKEKEILSLPNFEQNAAREDPLFIPEASEDFLGIDETRNDLSTFFFKTCSSNLSADEAVAPALDDFEDMHLASNSSKFLANLSTNCDVSNYVAVQVFESEKLGSSNMKVDNKTQEIFKELEQRIQRTTSKVKRPLSMYTLFMKEKYPEVAYQNPGKKGPEIIKILSSLWRNLPSNERQYWKEKANELLKDFKIKNPDYVYCPKKAQDEKFEYYRRKLKRRNMFKINPYIPKF